MAAHNSFIQLIDENGHLQKKLLEDFIGDSSQFSSCGLSYHVVSIMGPQSSGKSTLLNGLFNCRFQVMNEDNGRTQTTQGIWIAKSIRPCMLIIDTEGSDGNERGLDDTSFEKQSALFTLMISDIIILNMWFRDVGRANGSGLPLLEIIFQERMRLQDEHPARSRKRLLVILRDSPCKNHKAVLAVMDQIKTGIQKVWDSVSLRVGKNIALAHYFKLEAFPLPDYENCRDVFDAKVAELQGQLSAVPAATVDRFPIGGLSQGIEKIWTTIKNNANLHLPSIKESVSQYKRREIAETIIKCFKLNTDYKKLSEALDVALLPNFRAEMEHLLQSRLHEYRTESHLYDVKNSAELEEDLKFKLFEIMKCLYEKNIRQIANNELTLFKNCTTQSKEIDTKMKSSLEEFEKKCAECAIPNAGWSCSQVKQSLEHEMKVHQFEIYKIEATKELVSQDKCREITKNIIKSFKSREDYNKLSEALDGAWLPNFRAEMEHLLESRLQEYRTESHLYDVKNSAELEEDLKSKLFEIMKCLYEKNIRQIANNELTLFKNCTTRSKEIDTKMKSSLVEFEKKCAECAIPNAGWSCSQVKQSLELEMKVHQLEISKKEAAKTGNAELALKIADTVVKAGATAIELTTKLQNAE